MFTLRIILVSAALALGACSQNDTEITHRVQDRLAEAAVTDQVKVSTERRIVHLEGVVRDNNELNRAELAARNVPGVIAVDNRIVIQNPVNTTGGAIQPQPKEQNTITPLGPESPTSPPVRPATP